MGKDHLPDRNLNPEIIENKYAKGIQNWVFAFLFSSIVLIFHIVSVTDIDIFLEKTPLTFIYFFVPLHFPFPFYYVLIPVLYLFIKNITIFRYYNVITETNEANENTFSISPFSYLNKYIKLSSEGKKYKIETIVCSMVFLALPQFLLLLFLIRLASYQSIELTTIHAFLLFADILILMMYFKVVNKTLKIKLSPFRIIGTVNNNKFHRKLKAGKKCLNELFLYKNSRINYVIVFLSIIYFTIIIILINYYITFVLVCNHPEKLNNYSLSNKYPKLTISYYSDEINKIPNFQDRKFNFAKIEKIKIKNRNFSNSSFYGAKFYDINFDSCIFNSTNFTNVIADNSTFKNSSFTNSMISSSRFNSSNFLFTKFTNCRIDLSSFSFSNFSFSEFTDFEIKITELNETDFSSTHWCTSKLFLCDLSGSKFLGADFRTTEMWVVNFSEVNLNYAIFDGNSQGVYNPQMKNYTLNNIHASNFIRAKGKVFIDENGIGKYLNNSDHFFKSETFSEIRELITSNFIDTIQPDPHSIEDDFENLKYRILDIYLTNRKHYDKLKTKANPLNQDSIQIISRDSLSSFRDKRLKLFKTTNNSKSKKPSVCFSDEDIFYKDLYDSYTENSLKHSQFQE